LGHCAEEFGVVEKLKDNREDHYRKITALRDDAGRNRENGDFSDSVLDTVFLSP